jgi:crotonobetainyl-CoA:carnitine CoA-transferase CaiB-like acyl-CoA transferase
MLAAAIRVDKRAFVKLQTNEQQEANARLTTALDGIRVLDMARLGPGPHCAQILADLGADVIKIEAPPATEGKRAGREINLPPDAAIRRNSRSISLNLKSDDGRAAFYRLAKTADVVMEGFRPGVVKRLAVDYETLRQHKPDIIYASLTGYGQTGPYADYVGHDLNYLGLTGIVDFTGAPDGPPMIPGNTIADNAGGGMNAVISILAAVVAKQRTGVGQYIDCAMVDGLLTMMFLNVDDHVTSGEVLHRGETITTGRYAWYNIYETKDGKYLTVCAIEPWFFENLCRLLGREEFIPHQRDEGEKRDEMFAAFREIFLTKTRDEWVSELMPAETCVAPVYAMDEVVRDPHLRHRQSIVEPELPGNAARPQVGVMVKLSETPGRIHSPGIAPGANTDEVLAELGYDAAAIDAMRAVGAVG